MKTKPCPLCGSARTAEFCRLKNAKILACRTCRNAWTFPPPPEVDYTEEDFHGSNFAAFEKPNSYENLPFTWRRCIAMQADLLGRSLNNGARILEIGCGEGLLLQQLAQRGFRTSGIEPGRSAAARARSKGLDVTTGYFRGETVSGPFNAVVLSHVLEHVADPRKLLLEIKAYYPTARILLIQTNFRGIIPLVRRDGWYAWATHQHFWHFSVDGLKSLARSLGYEQEAYEYSSLVHTGRIDSLLMRIAELIPSLHDQFHLLLSPLALGGSLRKNSEA